MNYFDQLKEEKNGSPAKKPAARAAPVVPASRSRGFGSRRGVIRDIVPPSLRKPGGGEKPTVNPVRTGASRSADGSIILPSAPLLDTADRSRRRSNGVKTLMPKVWPAEKPSPPPFKEEKEEIPETGREDERLKEEIVQEHLAIRTWEPERVKKRRLKVKITVWGGTAILATAAVSATFLWPKLTITITPKAETASVSRITLVADTAISEIRPEGLRIPAIAVKTSKTLSRDYEATGRKFIEEKARGPVSIFNAFSSSPQILAASTRFQDPSGKIFRLPERVVIPGAKVTEGKIVPTAIQATLVADRPGENYNIGPAALKIPGFRGSAKYDGFYAQADSGFGGGFQGEAQVVLADDLKRASEELTRSLVADIKSDLEKKVPGGGDFFSPDGAREVVIASIKQPAAGDRLERFTPTATAEGRLIAVRQSDVNKVVALTQIPKDAKLSIQPAAKQNRLTISGVRLGPKESEMTFTASGDFIYWREDDISELTKTLVTSTPPKIEAYLRGRDEIGSFAVKKFPVWLWFMPRRENGFTIAVQPPA